MENQRSHFDVVSKESTQFYRYKNMDPSKVPPVRLPELLRLSNGNRVSSQTDWFEQRVPELKALFEQYVYGKMLPTAPIFPEELERDDQAVGGKATRIQTRIRVLDLSLDLVTYLPKNPRSPVPCFLGMNFTGNHAAFDDPAIPVTSQWMEAGRPGVENYRSTEASRATLTHRWPVELILSRGYGVATLYYGDVEPDYIGGIQKGPRRHFLKIQSDDDRKGDDPGAITSWAWGMSRVLDYLVTLPEIDPKRICLTGHSRLGKAALWASANDPRFALVISNNSGCGGASLSNHHFGEVYYFLSNVRPHWFSKNCMTASRNMDTFPVDQHMLIALSAPRPLFVSSAQDDPGADPEGEFLGIKHADPLYKLLGTEGLATETMPPLNQPVLSHLGYWIRSGKHDITPVDWKVHLDFADQNL